VPPSSRPAKKWLSAAIDLLTVVDKDRNCVCSSRATTAASDFGMAAGKPGFFIQTRMSFRARPEARKPSGTEHRRPVPHDHPGDGDDETISSCFASASWAAICSRRDIAGASVNLLDFGMKPPASGRIPRASERQSAPPLPPANSKPASGTVGSRAVGRSESDRRTATPRAACGPSAKNRRWLSGEYHRIGTRENSTAHTANRDGYGEALGYNWQPMNCEVI